MKKYLLVAKLAFQDILIYRLDFFIHVFKYGFAVSMMTFIWLAVQESGNVPGMTPKSTVIYFTYAAILYGVSNFHTWYVEYDIKQGVLSKYLLKPVSTFKYYLFYQSAAVLADILIKIIVLLPILTWLGYSVWISTPHVLLFIMFLPLIYFFSFCFQFAMATLAFWVTESYSLRWTSMIISRFLAGIFIPLHLFPKWYQQFSFLLPFPHLVYTQIQLLEGKLPLTAGIQAWFILLFWSGGAWLFKEWLWRKGTHSYEAVGA